MKIPTLLAALAAAILPFASPVGVQASPPQYTVTVLDQLGGTESYANGINGLGQVVGQSRIGAGNVRHAVLWTGTTPTDLGALGSSSSVGFSVNDSGQVAGVSFLYGSLDPERTAVRWDGTTPTPLGSGFDEWGLGINASGQVVGYFQTSGGNAHAALWNGTTQIDLGTLGGAFSSARGINDSGEVAGFAMTGANFIHAVRWTGTTATDLGTFGGNESYGYGINASGQVVGRAFLTGNSIYHATVWTGTTPTDLGTLGGSRSYGSAINAFGDVTGMSFTASDASLNAFLYTGGIMYDMNSLLSLDSGITSLEVGGINDFGQIAAHGIIDGQTRALRLDPVAAPEPASAVLLLGGAALLGLRRWR